MVWYVGMIQYICLRAPAWYSWPGFTKKEYFVEKLEMTVGLVQKDILLIVKTVWAGS